MGNKIQKFFSEEDLIAEALVSGLTHVAKNHPNLKTAIEKMPIEFWSRLNNHQRDEVEKRLKKFFKEEYNEETERDSD